MSSSLKRFSLAKATKSTSIYTEDLNSDITKTVVVPQDSRDARGVRTTYDEDVTVTKPMPNNEGTIRKMAFMRSGLNPLKSKMKSRPDQDSSPSVDMTEVEEVKEHRARRDEYEGKSREDKDHDHRSKEDKDYEHKLREEREYEMRVRGESEREKERDRAVRGEREREREREKEKEREKERERDKDREREREKREKRRRQDYSNIVFEFNNHQYAVLDLLGEGGSSKVYKVLSERRELFALKEIKIDGEQSHVANYESEIELLQKLRDEPYVIRLEDFYIDQQVIYMVFEIGSADLASIIKKAHRSPYGGLDETQIRYFWQEMIRCVQVCHRYKIIHLDLKPANFVSVNGQLKLIDFGIAKQVASDATSVLREDQIGTINYMAPETLDRYDNEDGFKLNRASDVWSLGCILFQMVYNHTPFAHEKNMLKKVIAISSPDPVVIPTFPNRLGGGTGDYLLLDVLNRCFIKDPRKRISLDDLFNHPYLRPSLVQQPKFKPLCSIPVVDVVNALTKASTKLGDYTNQSINNLTSDEKADLAKELLRTLMKG